jgi:AraC-like DNA-binding protein
MTEPGPAADHACATKSWAVMASDVAYAVGYESASQFSREYLRQFGAPPVRDMRRLRQSIDNQMIN